MDESAPAAVATGTVITSFAGGFVAGTYALVKGRGQAVATIYASSAALNCGIAGATFFSIREYIVSPALLYTLPSRQFERRRRQAARPSGIEEEPEKLTWWDMRTHKVPDSFSAGGITGSVLDGWRRGPRGILSGSLIGALGCAILQFSFNEVEVQRVKYVSRRLRAASTPSEPTTPPEPQEPLGRRILGMLGMNHLSDQEYLETMKREREVYLRRIAELERQQGGGVDKEP
ncbi:hypothetical protein OF83DRAFT_665481 [Amylostereum chailletii]|nr:hypothetical protein OF83DRAFT_665481 [Amylostereum chailletii]